MVISSKALFAGAIFLSSFLLFLVEPIAAKQLLPVFGGSAAVWMTCLVFFQVGLLAGYLYAHWMARDPRVWVHGGLLGLAVVSATLWAGRSLPVAAGGLGPSGKHLRIAGWLDRAAFFAARGDESSPAGLVCPD